MYSGERDTILTHPDHLTIDDAAAALTGKRGDLLEHIFSTITIL